MLVNKWNRSDFFITIAVRPSSTWESYKEMKSSAIFVKESNGAIQFGCEFKGRICPIDPDFLKTHEILNLSDERLTSSTSPAKIENVFYSYLNKDGLKWNETQCFISIQSKDFRKETFSSRIYKRENEGQIHYACEFKGKTHIIDPKFLENHKLYNLSYSKDQKTTVKEFSGYLKNILSEDSDDERDSVMSTESSIPRSESSNSLNSINPILNILSKLFNTIKPDLIQTYNKPADKKVGIPFFILMSFCLMFLILAIV